MKTDTRLGAGNVTIMIEGHITGINEVMQIKDIISSNIHARTFELVIKDAYVMPSALIGFLAKLVNVDGKQIVISDANAELKTLINDLNLNQTFLVR